MFAFEQIVISTHFLPNLVIRGHTDFFAGVQKLSGLKHPFRFCPSAASVWPGGRGCLSQQDTANRLSPLPEHCSCCWCKDCKRNTSISGIKLQVIEKHIQTIPIHASEWGTYHFHNNRWRTSWYWGCNILRNWIQVGNCDVNKKQRQSWVGNISPYNIYTSTTSDNVWGEHHHLEETVQKRLLRKVYSLHDTQRNFTNTHQSKWWCNS